jgi:UDP-2-acetamido-3-amino-2,3-dideoxy-glucuronate N-acetyltransferase
MSDLALIGCGYWGKNLARNFLHLGILHTLCDTDENLLASYGQEYGSVRKALSLDAVLSDPSVTKIAIATPAATHFSLAYKALLAGKDVYVEKPLCLSIAEATKLIALANSMKRVLMVGHLLQYHPYVAKLRELISEGKLGKLYYIASNRLNLGKIRREENALWSFAPHDISVILSLAGQRPLSVQCNGEHYLTKGVPDTTMTQLVFANGVRAHIYVSWLNPFKEQKLTVIGSEGMAVFDDTKPWADKLTLYYDYLKWEDGQVPVAMKLSGTPIVVPEDEPLLAECRHFVECCHHRLTPRTDGKEGLDVLRVLDAAQRSMQSDGHKTSVDETQQASYFAHETAIIDDGAAIGDGCSIWHFSHVSSMSSLGEGCNLGQNVFIAPEVSLGRNVKIQNNVSVYTGTTIEDDVFLGPSCVLTNVSNPRSQVNRKSIYETTTIRRGASIGANATIVCGITLGRYCFIAAGAVVTENVPDYALMMGVPAVQKGWMSRHGHRLDFDNQHIATCPESGFQYKLNTVDSSVRCLNVPEDEPLPVEAQIGSKSYREYKRES